MNKAKYKEMKGEQKVPKDIRLETWSHNTAVLSYLTSDTREVNGTGMAKKPIMSEVRGTWVTNHPAVHQPQDFGPLPPKPST